MLTLANKLGEPSHYSVLMRKARKLGLASPPDFVALGVARGCRHYRSIFPERDPSPCSAELSDAELVALLLHGSNEFEPYAIRCAAQLAGRCDPAELVRLAERERVSRPLAYIARAGIVHDPAHREFWTQIVEALGQQRAVPEGALPHWSRFVSQTGVTREGPGRVDWLHCS
jgi:hypothetical protein